MRLPASNVYRAFPELDRFSGEHCERFTRAARGSVWRKLRWLVVELVLSGIALLAAIVMLRPISRLFFGVIPSRWLIPDWANVLIDAAGIVLVLSAAALAWLFSRDLLLRRAIRHVINTRGSCIQCGYGLTGLPVGDDRSITCPECGHPLLADETMAEVMGDKDGVRRFMPSPDLVPRAKWMTPRRSKRLRRLAFTTITVGILLPALGWGGYEIFLWRQAKLAASEQVAAAAIDAYSINNQPVKDGPDAWNFFYRADAKMTSIDAAFAKKPEYARPDGKLWIYFDVYGDPIYGPPSYTGKIEPIDIQLAQELLAQYRADGVLQILDQMAASPRAVRPYNWPAPGTRPLAYGSPIDLNRHRSLWRLNSARMRLAFQAGDNAEFMSAFEAACASTRMLQLGPILTDRLTGVAFQGSVFDTIRQVLARQPGGKFAESMQAALDRQSAAIPPDGIIEAHRDVSLDLLAYLYSDPSNVRLGRFSSAPWDFFGIDVPYDRRSRPLGTYRHNRDWLKSFYQQAITDVQLSPFERPERIEPVMPSLFENLIPLSMRNILRIFDTARLNEQSIPVLIALERFRDARGQYPEALSELSPQFLASTPIDPYSGKPFGYKRLAPSRSNQSRMLLYSVGADRTDNDGRPVPGDDVARRDALIKKGHGYDFPLNLDEEAVNTKDR